MQINKIFLLILIVTSLSAGSPRALPIIFNLYDEIIKITDSNPNNHLIIMDLQEFPKNRGTIIVFNENGIIKALDLGENNKFKIRKIKDGSKASIDELRKTFQIAIDINKLYSRVSAIDADRFVFISKNNDNIVIYVMRENQTGFVDKLVELEKKILINE